MRFRDDGVHLTFTLLSATLTGLLAASTSPTLAAATPTAEQALKLTPVQADVEFERANDSDLSKCTIKAESIDGKTGWVVRGPAGQVLRQFIDSNKDNVVDLWCYYNEGIEIYRDIDSNFNGKADQYRWLNTAGTRWALDHDEDGTVDEWKRISAEEVSAEAVAALASHDARRFERLLLTGEELKGLGLGPERQKSLREKIEQAPAAFKSNARKQKGLSAKSVWLQFGGTRPGLVPAGTDESTNDLICYENVISMVETDGKPGQVVVGTLVQVGDIWKLIDSPSLLDTKSELAAAPFFQPFARTRPGAGTDSGLSQQMQELLQKLEQLDQQSTHGTPEVQAANAAERCDVLEKIAESAPTAEDRAQWLRSLAETISASVQTGVMPDGTDRLKALHAKLAQEPGSEDLAAYVQFRYITALYNRELQSDEKIDFPQVQKKWLKNLKKYVADYPQSADTAEAMLQLGTNEEFSGEEEEAKKWYGQIVDQFPKSASAAKAAGAITRLDSVGKILKFHGAGLTGKTVDLSQFRKKVVLIQYWATWCEPCKADLETIKDAVAKYGKDGFTVVSISLDNKKEDVAAYLKKHTLPWTHIFEPGGLDSRLANELGVLTLPTMLLVDQDGKVVNRGINAAEIDREVKALLQQTADTRK
ncbi:MAG TPA: thioredoxin-like domain-containing protein [Pirellulales bacterium]|nr:thioredoxin-like domain-containing protein [Pirellulales bacterium]